jgi:hypothetical protein
MNPATTQDKLVGCLDEIESLLLSDHHYTQAGYIAKLRELYRSVMQSDQKEFQRLVTTDKFLWLGMGTIADSELSSKEAGQRFVRAYYDFAIECERLGFGSIYSRDLVSVFGKWIR